MFDQITLSNGLRIVGEKLTHVRSCTVGIWVKVGSTNENPNENGLSHFIEHLVFKGTEKRSARDIAEEMDQVGGQLNAFTSKECTCYYAKVIDEDMPLAVDILSDLVSHPTFDEVELNKERGVVLEEISMVEDTPDDLVHELLSEIQYNGSLRMPILGTTSLLNKYTQNDVINYWKKHYCLNNMVLAIAGNYDWDTFVNLANEAFSDFPNSNCSLYDYPAQEFISRQTARNKDTEQVHLCMGFPGITSTSDSQYTMSILNIALGGGMSSRLFQRIREDLGMAYSVYSYASGYLTSGALTIYAGIAPHNGERVLSEINDVVNNFYKNGITADEFLSAKAQLRSGYLLGLESSGGRMQSLGRGLLLLNRLRDSDQVLAGINAVTIEDVHTLANQVLSVPPSLAIVGKNSDTLLEKWKESVI